MLLPSSLYQDEKWHKKELNWLAQAYLYVFYSSLEYRSPYYKRGVQQGDLDKTKVHKTQRDSKSDVRKPNSKRVLKSILPIRPVLHTGQTSLTCLRASLIHRTCSIPLPNYRDIYRTCLVNNMTIEIWAPPDKSGLHQTCSGSKSNLPIQRVSFR
jgi:hypothetical protein